MKKTLYFLVMLICFADIASAQLSFPNGTILDLETTSSSLYPETEIRFYTGMYKVTDYNWSRAFADSLDPTWDIQACMNGDCKIGLPVSGPFTGDFGINDTTGFIRFHVYVGNQSGKSILKYYVRNTHDQTDNALLIFNISYQKTTGVFDVVKDSRKLFIYPNPAADDLRITGLPTGRNEFKIYNMVNQLVYKGIFEQGQEPEIHIGQLPEGLYQLVSGSYHQTFTIRR